MITRRVRDVIDDAMHRYDVRGIALQVAQLHAAQPESFYVGEDVDGVALNADSLFPVASITKLATALTVLRLVDAGALGLNDPLARYVPDAEAAQPGVTVRALLCHSSGLPQDFPNEAELYLIKMNWESLASRCLTVPLERAPNTRVLYSNVGYGLLALIVERLTDKSFRANLQSQVIQPLGIEAYLGMEPPRTPVRIAGVRSRHAGTEREPFNSRHWRSRALPWAGLLTSARGALALLRAFAGDPHDYLSEDLRREATSDQTGGLPGGYGGRFDYQSSPWGLGPDIRDTKKPHWAPDNSSERTFGHAGASGCVAWCDPDAGVAWSILGTRVADNGWLVRASRAMGAALLRAE